MAQYRLARCLYMRGHVGAGPVSQSQQTASVEYLSRPPFPECPEYPIRQVTARWRKPYLNALLACFFITRLGHFPIRSEAERHKLPAKEKTKQSKLIMLEKILWKKTLGNRELFVITKHFQPLAHRSQVYTEQQEQLGRPLSPSLTVYKQAVPAISSITNRMCGIALSLGFGAAGAAASVGGDVPSLIYAAQDAVPGFIYISKFAVAFPFAYHWLTGVRHQIWNYQNPDLMNLQFAPKSSYAIFTTAALLGVAATGCTIRSPIYKEQGSKQQH